MKEHFRNSKFPCEMDHYLPVVFSPPRDGKQLTEPLPIVGQKNQPIIISTGPSAKANEEEEEVVQSVFEGCEENLRLGDIGGCSNTSGNSSSNHFDFYCDSDDTVDQHQEEEAAPSDLSNCRQQQPKVRSAAMLS